MATDQSTFTDSMDAQERLKQIQAEQEIQKIQIQNLGDLLDRLKGMFGFMVSEMKGLQETERQAIAETMELHNIMEQYATMETEFFHRVQARVVIAEKVEKGRTEAVARVEQPTP
jgi:hypothetical protein